MNRRDALKALASVAVAPAVLAKLPERPSIDVSGVEPTSPRPTHLGTIKQGHIRIGDIWSAKGRLYYFDGNTAKCIVDPI